MHIGPHLQVVVIVQARMGAARFPGKPLKTILSRPLLHYLIERLKRVKLATSIVIATTTNERDDPIANLALQEKVNVFRGSEEDVLSRYIEAAKQNKADIIVRITADCPLIDPLIIDQVIQGFLDVKPPLDYFSNALTRTFPRGLDVEVFSYKALQKAHQEAKLSEEREHVTLYLYRHPELFRIGNFCYIFDASSYRLTVDTPEDFELITKIYESLYPTNPHFTLEDVLKLLDKHPELTKINAHIKQKEV